MEVEDIFICDEQTVSASASVDEVSLPIINEYEIEEIPFEPVDIKKLNSIPINDDQIIGPFNIGFDFNFFNESYSEFWISSNGYISFIEPSAGYNSHPIPNANGPYSTIFGAWEDWNPGEGGELRLGQFSNQLIIDFRNISSYNCGGNSDTAGTSILLTNMRAPIHCKGYKAQTGNLLLLEKEEIVKCGAYRILLCASTLQTSIIFNGQTLMEM